jgi:hypothetical protein
MIQCAYSRVLVRSSTDLEEVNTFSDERIDLSQHCIESGIMLLIRRVHLHADAEPCSYNFSDGFDDLYDDRSPLLRRTSVGISPGV